MMFGLIMPWTKKRLLKEAEEARLHHAKLDAHIAEVEARRKAHILAEQKMYRVTSINNASTQKKALDEQKGYASPRPGYVSDYTTTDGEALMMSAMNNAMNNARSGHYDSTSCDSSNSSGTDNSAGSSSDSGSCGGSD